MYSSTVFKNLLKRIKTRVGQQANYQIGLLVANNQQQPSSPRIAQILQKELTRLGYKEQSYKACLLTESQCLRAEAAYGPVNAAWAGVAMPVTRLFAYQLRRKALAPTRRIAKILHMLRRNTSTGNPTQHAGLFRGMGYEFRASTDNNNLETHYYSSLTFQAESLLATYQTVQPQHYGKGSIGILISCYKPEAHITGFLENLLELHAPERLVPVIINAGMSEACLETIESTLMRGNFRNFHILRRPDSGIYAAWNAGIKALGNEVEYITNFNVDDRRHPLCLQVQAECLNTFPSKKVAVTDYTYFFRSSRDTQELFNLNSANRSYAPVINKRTLVDRNFPHSSPLWRQSLHEIAACGLFNENYKSAGDADFWYRVSRQYANPFAVISIPLSLYYQNPYGLSTRPSTAGVSEHELCTREHYQHLTKQIDTHISAEFARLHIMPAPLEHIQLYAMSSSLKKQ